MENMTKTILAERITEKIFDNYDIPENNLTFEDLKREILESLTDFTLVYTVAILPEE